MKKHERIPGMNNGPNPQVPADITWDADNPPVLFVCSNHLFHLSGCDGNCGELVATENRVNLINEGLAFARAGMSWRGIPSAYEATIPVPGVKVELTDMLIWMEQMRDIFCEMSGISPDEFEDEFARRKYEFLHRIRIMNESHIRKQQIVDMIRTPILGPDGNPL